MDSYCNRNIQDSTPFQRTRTSQLQLLSWPRIISLFNLPLSAEAHQEFLDLQHLLLQLQTRDHQTEDIWHYQWNSKSYSSSKFYHLTFKHIQPPSPFIWIWDSKCSNKLRVFAWLLLMDRLSTRNILRRKNHKLQDNNYNCVLCQDQREETAYHLFFTCSFSRQCWQHLGIQWNTNIQFFEMMQQAKAQATHSFFMEIFIIAAWNIWKQRNDQIFNRNTPTITNWKHNFINEADLQAHRMPMTKQTDFNNLTQLYR